MFNNIGAKIKGVVKFFFVLECIGSVILGVSTGVAVGGAGYFGGKLLYGSSGGAGGVLLGFLAFVLVSAVGILLAWLSCLLVYGYGELIDRATSIDNKLNQVTTAGSASDTGRMLGANKWQCACGKINSLFVETCSCGRTRPESPTAGKS